jgi:biotin operon repressor
MSEVQVFQRTRRERLISLSSGGSICIETVARIFDCPEASIRRDIFALRQEGYYITLEEKQIRNYGKRTALLPEQETT